MIKIPENYLIVTCEHKVVIGTIDQNLKTFVYEARHEHQGKQSRVITKRSKIIRIVELTQQNGSSNQQINKSRSQSFFSRNKIKIKF